MLFRPESRTLYSGFTSSADTPDGQREPFGATQELQHVLHLKSGFQKQFRTRVLLVTNGMIVVEIALMDIVVNDHGVNVVDCEHQRFGITVNFPRRMQDRNFMSTSSGTVGSKRSCISACWERAIASKDGWQLEHSI
jgi:hypothetical protein